MSDLHRALLRPAIIHILRAAGFNSTKPAVLDTLVNLAERYLILLASTSVQHAMLSHNDPVPSVTDVRMALTECGALLPADSAAEEEWREIMRTPIHELDEEDVRDITNFKRWFDGPQHTEMRRIAGMLPDPSATGSLPAVGVGGGIVHGEDFLTMLKKKHGKGGDESRLQGTVLGKTAEDREIVLEGGPVQRIRDWRPRQRDRSGNSRKQSGMTEEKMMTPVEQSLETVIEPDEVLME
ncbi:MAG: hypothetical protein FE78DRAFT_144211 [Acidomyces sp. 'richmondensis']|nr:MAG: hypothetical protein FE78DRAFT_144211 [Acidomyces sp. 'richmondensis']